jgi:flagellar protein FliL
MRQSKRVYFRYFLVTAHLDTHTMAKKPKEEAEEGAAEGAEEGKKGSKKKLIIIIAAVLLLAGGGGGFYFLKMKKAPAHGEEAKVAPKKVAFVDMKDMNINLAPTPGQERPGMMKLKVSLEVSDAKLTAEIQPLLPRIEDTFQVYMRELRVADLEGSMGVYRLKEELLRRVNIAVYPSRVDAILFKEILVQ